MTDDKTKLPPTPKIELDIDDYVKNAKIVVEADRIRKADAAKAAKEARETAAKEAQAARELIIVTPESQAALAAYERFSAKLTEAGGWPAVTGKNSDPIKDSQINVMTAIDVLGLECSYDFFKNSYQIFGFEFGGGLVGDLSDKMIRLFRDYTFRMLGYEPGIMCTREGLKLACEKNTINSVQDYLNGLPKWDGKERTATWLTVYAGAEDTPLHREWGKLFLMALCRRAFEPGCKFDHVLSLEGPEGGGKSTLGKILAGAKDPAELCKFFSDSTILDKHEKEQLELCQGVWVYELSEMSGANKTEQRKLKAFVVRQEDRAREAYAYLPTAQPRSPVFFATINPEDDGEIPEYLNEGDRRRWWPLAVCVTRDSVDFEGMIRDRDQLFAEAMLDAKDDLTDAWLPLVPDPKLKALAKIEQEARAIKHPYRDLLAPLFDHVIKRDKAGYQKDDDNLYVVTPTMAWVRPAYVYSRLPPNAATNDGGRAVKRGMTANGWKQSRTGEGVWYFKERREPVAEFAADPWREGE